MTDFMRRLLLPYPYLAPEDEGAGGGETEKLDEGAAAESDGADAEEGKAADAGEGTEGADGEGSANDASEEVAEGSDDDTAKPSAALTDELRDLVAGDDKDLRKLLGRYTSIKTLAQALKSAQAKIAKGPAKMAMPDPKDEKAMAEWRKSEGIPDDPTGYELPDTVKTRMTDEDKPLIASFTEYAHQKGATPAAVNLAAEWYFDTLETMEGERLAKDNEARETAEESLRDDWGAEYKANLRLAAGFVETIPGVGKDWSEARMPDGRRLGDIPEFMVWASEQGRVEFGDPVFANSDSAERHTSRIAEIEQIRDTDFDRYEREGLDRELIKLREKDLARGRAA